jgi:N-acetylneuraminate synthase
MPAKSGEGPPFPLFVAGVASNHHRDLQRCLDFVRSAEDTDLTLRQCNSAYPTKAEDCNLGTMRDACQCPVGWSDHTVDAAVIYRAVHQWRATMVECHELEGQAPEFNAGHCWLRSRGSL